MTETQSNNERLLIKSERWNPPRRGKSKLEEAKDAIFNLRHNKGLSYTAIKRFLDEEGISTSTAALSSFCKSRFNPENAVKVKPLVLARLAELMPAEGKVPTT